MTGADFDCDLLLIFNSKQFAAARYRALRESAARSRGGATSR